METEAEPHSDSIRREKQRARSVTYSFETSLTHSPQHSTKKKNKQVQLVMLPIMLGNTLEYSQKRVGFHTARFHSHMSHY